MTSTFNQNRNGTSQSQRNIDALSPDYFLLEERSITDLILFAQKHAEILKYYDSNNQINGNWTAYLDGDPKEMARFLNEPSFFDAFPEKKTKYSRPHLVLFLVFLKLLRKSHALINKLTKKQLDFYYREALGFSTKKAVPDRVHVLANIHVDETQVLIPKGTLLQAGVNGQGDPVEYSTDQDLVADHSRVARLMSLYVQKEVTDFPLLRFQNKAEADSGFLSVLQLVYRKPGTMNSPRDFAKDRPLVQDVIEKLDTLEETITQVLKLRIAGFQRLMQDYHFWENIEEWNSINSFLLVTYNGRKGKELKSLPTPADTVLDPRDFDNNFEIALGFSIDGKSGGNNVFDGIPAVSNIYDLFDYNTSFPNDTKIIDFISEKFKSGTSEFRKFMEDRIRIVGYMKSVHQYLKAVAAGNQIPPGSWDHFDYEKDKVLAKSYSYFLGVTEIDGETISNDQDFVKLELQLENLEKYFRMPAEDYFFIRNLYLVEKAKKVPKWKWDRADRLLERAYQSWLKRDRRESDPTEEQTENSSEETAAEDRTEAGSPETASRIDGSQKPEIITWKNIYQATDAAKLQVVSTVREEPYPRWKTFGAVPNLDSDCKSHFAADIGWGISSPALALSEGKRELTVSIIFEKEKFDAQRPTLVEYLDSEKIVDNTIIDKGYRPFRIEISTAKGWVELTEWSSFEIDATNEIDARKGLMKIIVSAAEDIDPFAPLEDDPNNSPWPSLRLILQKKELINKDGNLDSPKQAYELFKDQSLEKLELGIKVTGLRNLLIQNKDGSVDPKKPFDIFGSIPELGDRLYITHPELASQKLDSLTVNLEWKNLPKEGLAEYYKTYGEVLEAKKEPPPANTAGGSTSAGDDKKDPIKQDSFLVNLSLLDAHRWTVSLASGHTLFPDDGETTTILTTKDIPDIFPKNGDPYLRNSNAKTDPEVINSDRYLEIELQPQDFLHNRFAAISQELAYASLQDSTSKTVSKNGESDTTFTFKQPPPVLNEPYKPTLKGLQVDYETSLTIDWKTGQNSEEDKLAHIEPFGLYFLPNNVEDVPFLPSFEKEGSLFIGLENLHPPQNISFLFQLAEGSADPDLEPSKVTWSYLSGNDWIELKKEQLLTDTTGGLLSSGLIQIHVPGNASLHHARMPDGLYWLRAEVDRFSGSLSDCIDIRTQALSAKWSDPGKPSDHLEQPLNPETITEPVEPVLGLSSFTQPFSSFLGKAAEADDQLYRRASGVLRHKQRALTIWDYENLVLEEFPDIFRAKAISADVWGDDYEPGSVRIVVIPDIRKRKPFDPFEPKVPVIRLREIQQFLQESAPAFARIHVQNARFMYLKLRVKVRFNDMNNFGFFAGQLNQELLEYLAPWAFDKSVDIVFGGKIYPSIIVDFIEDRSYVDYIDKPGLKFMKRKASGSIEVLENQPSDDEGQLIINEPDVVIVSAHQHLIEYLPLQQESLTRVRQGIGWAKIGFDFNILTEEGVQASPK